MTQLLAKLIRYSAFGVKQVHFELFISQACQISKGALKWAVVNIDLENGCQDEWQMFYGHIFYICRPTRALYFKH